jgi:hypothetical protein
MAEQNCWEILSCGREEGGANVSDLGVCPAYPDNGKTCFSVAKTLCKGVIQGNYEQKIVNCRVCDVYKKIVLQAD